MSTILTPNPFQDQITAAVMSRLSDRMHSELQIYDGRDVPTKQQLSGTFNRLSTVFYNGLYTIGSHSLELGCREVNVSVPSIYKVELSQVCRARASFAAQSVIDTTSIAFGVMHAALSKKGALGKKRSKSASKYEGSRIFFEQRAKAWRLKAGVMKAWYCASNPCDICQDNEDDGRIPIDQEFSSGDIAPPVHLNCECLMSLIL